MADNKEYITYPEKAGSINISEEVVAAIAGSAVFDVDGVDGLYSSPGKDLAEIIGKKSLTKGVRIKVEDDGVSVDVFLTVKAGKAVCDIGKAVQDSVKTAVEATTGLSVCAVNVHISGVTFK